MVFINDPSFLLSSWWKNFFIALVLSLKPMASFSGRISPHIFRDVFHKPTTSLLFLLLVFQQLRSTLLLKMFFKLIWGRRCCFPLRSFDSILTFILEALYCCYIHPSSCFVKDHVLPFAYPFNRSIMFFIQVLLSYHVLPPFSTEGLSEFVLPCSSFLTECFQPCSSSLYSFFQFVRPRKVLWFHLFVKETT